ncbi:c-type lysozyme/alpha-lactalbumin family domain-containing protein [Phthorimaea operculella]|nr:c-type lysozyme/alpha-lactalbumin family domain-containing protein [Phthorimaea operculella]
MQKFMFMLLVLGVVLQTQAYHMTECQLLHALRNNGFPEHQLRNWMCLVQNESGRCTNKISPVNKNGSRDYGLFQINDKYWCSNTNVPGKDCHVTCADLITDDITKAAKCAKKIYKRHGFRAWYGWINHCQGALPPLPHC